MVLTGIDPRLLAQEPGAAMLCHCVVCGFNHCAQFGNSRTLKKKKCLLTESNIGY